MWNDSINRMDGLGGNPFGFECPDCGGKLTFYSSTGDYFCDSCNKLYDEQTLRVHQDLSNKEVDSKDSSVFIGASERSDKIVSDTASLYYQMNSRKTSIDFEDPNLYRRIVNSILHGRILFLLFTFIPAPIRRAIILGILIIAALIGMFSYFSKDSRKYKITDSICEGAVYYSIINTWEKY